MPKDKFQSVTFEEFVGAVSVFANDYNLVGESGAPIKAPWDEPNEAGTYSLTQIPEGLSEGEFVERVQEVSDIAITCMDKDCAHSTWEKIDAEPENTLMFTWGGGVVQHNVDGREGAVEAIATIASYFARLKHEGRWTNLKHIHADDHDSVCGAVKDKFKQIS